MTTTPIIIPCLSLLIHQNNLLYMPFEDLLKIVCGALAWARQHILGPVEAWVHLRVFLPLTTPQSFQLDGVRFRVEIDLCANVRIVNNTRVVVFHYPVHVTLVFPYCRHLQGGAREAGAPGAQRRHG